MMVTWVGDSQFNDNKIDNSVLSGGGGYDLEELKQAHETLSGHDGDEKGFEEVESMFIQVNNGIPVREEEFEARSVIIEYDQFDEIVSVELL